MPLLQEFEVVLWRYATYEKTFKVYAKNQKEARQKAEAAGDSFLWDKEELIDIEYESQKATPMGKETLRHSAGVKDEGEDVEEKE